MQLNVNGIKGKFKKLNELARDYNVDVVVVSELKTNHYHTFDRAEFDHMIGYTLYLDSARCAVYVRQELQKHTKHITVGDEKQTEDAGSPRTSSTAARYPSPTQAHNKSYWLCRATAHPAQ